MRILLQIFDTELINIALIVCFRKNEISDENSTVTSDSSRKKKLLTRVSINR